MKSVFSFVLLAFASLSLGQDARPKVAPGTVVRLRLERTISTRPHGGLFGVVGVRPETREDSFVSYSVAEDVVDADGNLLIPEGSTASGVVIDSRVAGGFKPHSPHLAVTVDSVETPDGTIIPIRFSQQHGGQWAHTFGRAETSKYVESRRDVATEHAFSLPSNSESVRELFELVIEGRFSELLRHPVKLLRLKYLAQQSGLPTLLRAIQTGEFFQLAQTIADIQSGRFVVRSFGDWRILADAFRVMNDTWKAGHQLVTWLGGRVEAPQILVPAGFPLEAVVAG